MSRPNILILYVDQMRWDAMGAAGNRHIKTPNLDRLAAEGTRFSHCFVQNPLCMPSRVSFLTGRYPSSLGIPHMGVNVPEDIPTLAHILKPYGYRTANFGKLHFQTHSNRDHRLPHPSYGFDELEVSDEPGVYEDAYRAWVRRHAPEQLAHLSVGLPPATSTWQETFGIEDPVTHPSPAARDDFAKVIPFPGDERYTHSAFVAHRTIDFLSRQIPNHPFLCIAGFYSPHAPLVVPQRFLDLYERETLPIPAFTDEEERQRAALGWTDSYLREMVHGYYAMVSEVDFYVGRILSRLHENLMRNTIVVFTSDHGEWLGDQVRFGKGYPGDDPVSRVPCLLKLPQHETPSRSDYLIEAIDLLPTLLDAAEIQPPPFLQGKSAFNLLLGRPYTPRTSALTEFDGWKSLRTAEHRYLIHENGEERLTKIENDREWPMTDDNLSEAIIADHRHQLLQRLLENELPRTRQWVY